MKECSFKRFPDDPNCHLEEGYFHGFFQEDTNNAKGLIFAILHSKNDANSIPFRFYKWNKGLYFNKKDS